MTTFIDILGYIIYMVCFYVVFKYLRCKVKAGNVYAVDKKNIMNQDIDSVISVVAVERVKYKPFHKSIWKCYDAEDYDKKFPIEVPECFMSECNTTVVRYPFDIPVINDDDLKVLLKIDRSFKDNSTVITNNDISRYHAIMSKMVFLNDNMHKVATYIEEDKEES